MQERGLIAWMARNPVAANLFMFVVMIAGINAIFSIQKEVFPSLPSETILISVPYPGASPEEVEQGVLIKIEESIQAITNIKEIRSTANEGAASILVMTEVGANVQDVLNKIKVQVDSISSFPKEVEQPVIEEVERRSRVLILSLYGELDEKALKAQAEKIREDLLLQPGISQIAIEGDKSYEISIEVTDYTLNLLGITFNDVVSAIQKQSKDLPGGTLRTESGTITLRSIGQAYSEQDFNDIVVVSKPDGTQIKLGDIAKVSDGFAEKPVLSRFNTMPAVNIRIDQIGDQNSLAISRICRDYVDKKSELLPSGVSLVYWSDSTEVLKSRINLLLRSAIQGILLIAIVLALFLELSLAFWVVAGLPFCILGTFWVMTWPMFNASINVISLFGFIMVLGILVDDAVITSESAYSQLQKDKKGLDSIIKGVKRVAVPTVFGVLTTIFAFLPSMFATEGLARMFSFASPVIIIALIFSLIETKLILPAHLRHLTIKDTHRKNAFERFQAYFAAGLKRFCDTVYSPLILKAIHYRYITLSVFIAALILAVSFVKAGIVKQVFFPTIPSDFIQAELIMPPGTPYERTHAYAIHLEKSLMVLNERYKEVTGLDQAVIKHLDVISENDTEVEVRAELIKSTERDITSVELARWWREEVGTLSGIKSFSIDAQAGHASIPIDIELMGDNLVQLREAAIALRIILTEFDGVYDVRDTFDAGGPEINVQLSDEGRALGLGQVELARQVRQAVYGVEIQRIQRGRDEVKVFIRLPESQRHSLDSIKNLWVSLPNGKKVPFSVVGKLESGEGVSKITRLDRRRVVNVQADINKSLVSPTDISENLEENYLATLQNQYPDIIFHIAGDVESQQKSNSELLKNAAVILVLIYAALAIPLRSYGQPLLILGILPFSLVGVIIGHKTFGLSISVISLIGIIAMFGVAINDSLVLIDDINQRVKEGIDRSTAILESGSRRFRAVILTSVTTFVGLLPIQLETSIQAQFLKPMAVSLSFGVMFSTLVTLILVPCISMMVLDIKQLSENKKVVP